MTPIDKARRAEIRKLTRDRKALSAQALKDLTGLRKQADKIVARHREADAILARRIQIVESRLG
ncbi:MAG TPA: hypothetical protein PLA50_05115 [Bacteroidia bacterium]|nr:hypothetical protein [Bacteroidia bacterium]